MLGPKMLTDQERAAACEAIIAKQREACATVERMLKLADPRCADVMWRDGEAIATVPGKNGPRLFHGASIYEAIQRAIDAPDGGE